MCSFDSNIQRCCLPLYVVLLVYSIPLIFRSLYIMSEFVASRVSASEKKRKAQTVASSKYELAFHVI